MISIIEDLKILVYIVENTANYEEYDADGDDDHDNNDRIGGHDCDGDDDGNDNRDDDCRDDDNGDGDHDGAHSGNDGNDNDDGSDDDDDDHDSKYNGDDNDNACLQETCSPDRSRMLVHVIIAVKWRSSWSQGTISFSIILSIKK